MVASCNSGDGKNDSDSGDDCLGSAISGESARPEGCADCGSSELRRHDAREELVRLASQTDRRLEVAGGSEELRHLEGVGCLLRYNDWGPSAVSPLMEAGWLTGSVPFVVAR